MSAPAASLAPAEPAPNAAPGTSALAGALTIARFTLAEAVSRRLVLAGVVLSSAFIALYAVGFVLVHRQATTEGGMESLFAGSLLTALGAYAVHFLAGFLALFLSVGAVSAEVDSGALLAILARPLPRRSYILGRWLALSSLVAVYVAVMVAALLVVARVVSGVSPLSPTRAIALMALEAVLLLTLALLGSTRLSTLANGVVVFSLFGLAWLAGIIEFIGNVVGNATMRAIGIAVSLVIPSDAVWRGASFYVQSPTLVAVSSREGGIPLFGATPPARALLAWAVGYIVVCLALALRGFGRRDL